MELIPRSEWGARYAAGYGGRSLPAPKTSLHHSVTLSPDLHFTDLNADSRDDDEVNAMRTIERIGQQRFGRGFSYNLAVMPSFRVYVGCGLDRIGSHTGGRNTSTMGIVLVGNYQDNDVSQAIKDGMPVLLRHLHDIRAIDEPKIDWGHRDLKSTSCPGDHAYRLIPHWNSLAAGGGGSIHTPTPTPTPQPTPTGDDEMDKIVARWGLLKRGSNGQGVRLWQGLLNGMGRTCAVDGDFGPTTERLTREWQAASGAPGGVDGVVGAGSWGRALGTR